jgi:membrane fusion protein (multidrug efflux system)
MSAPQAAQSPIPPRPAPKPLVAAAATAILLGGLAGWHFWGSDSETTEDAYVQGNVVQVTSQISGTVVAIEADTTDHVGVGNTLIRLNPVDAKINFERAQAALARATRLARAQYLQVEQLSAEVTQRQNDLAKATSDLARRQQLSASGAISREEIRHSETIVKNARAALEASQQSLAQRHAMVDGTQLRTHPDVVTAASNLRDAYIALMRTSIVAPVAGTVTKRDVQVGQRINPGVALMSVVPLDALWVNANFKESQLEHLQIGQPVSLTSDVYGPDTVYHGKIVGLDAGTGSAFALLPAQNATGNWIKVTQRVPVRIGLDATEVAERPLRIGLSMHVSVDTRDRRGDMIRSAVSSNSAYRTQAFDHELQDADALVESVIRANEGGATVAGR